MLHRVHGFALDRAGHREAVEVAVPALAGAERHVDVDRNRSAHGNFEFGRKAGAAYGRLVPAASRPKMSPATMGTAETWHEMQLVFMLAIHRW